MDELINKLTEKTGIDKATAEKVVEFLKEHAADLPKWLGNAGVGGDLMGKIGGFFGNKE